VLHYPQYCEKCMQQYLVLSGAILRFFAPTGATCCSPVSAGVGSGAPKWKILLNSYQILPYERVTLAHHLYDFCEILRDCGDLAAGVRAKIWGDLMKRFQSHRVLILGGLVTHRFLAPPSGETMYQTLNVLKVQEHARGPLSPCQVRWPRTSYTTVGTNSNQILHNDKDPSTFHRWFIRCVQQIQDGCHFEN